MKRIVLIIAALALVLSFAGCKSDTNKNAAATTSHTAEVNTQTLVKFLDTYAAAGRFNWNSFSEEEQSFIKLQAASENIKLEVKDDGVMVVSDSNGLVITYGCDWPSDNEYFKNFTAPVDVVVAYTYVQKGTLCYVGMFTSMENCKKFATQFADCGYDSNKTEYDYSEQDYYYFAATNSDDIVAFVVMENGFCMAGVMPNS